MIDTLRNAQSALVETVKLPLPGRMSLPVKLPRPGALPLVDKLPLPDKLTLQRLLGRVSELYPRSAQPLAEPPTGSGLKPVMGEWGLPVLGRTLEELGDPLRITMSRFEEYGPVSWSGSLGMKLVTAVGPEALETVWMNRDRAFSNEKGWEPIIGAFFHRGIMLLDFDEHLYHRRILQQAFTPKRLVSYLDIVNPQITRTLAGWQPADDFRFYDRTKEMLLSLASEVFVGGSLGDRAHDLEQAFEACVRGGQAMIRTDIGVGTWSDGLRGRELLEEFFRSEIPARRAGQGDDLFSVLCHAESDDGERFTDEDIVNHMIFAMMAAHDTSTIALSMMVYYLGRHPEWQQRLREESLALNKPTLDYDDLDAMTGMDLAFKETVRINAPVGMIFRKAIKDTEIVGHFIPKGATVILHPWASMLREEWWPEPHRWDPERFSAERREDKIHRFAWSPFGGGAHKCIGLYFAGMEVKSILHQLLLGFEWSIPDGYVPPMTYGTGPIPADGIPISLRRR